MEGDRILAARYRLIGKLVEGGMGAVWRAEHLTLRTHVAIKLIDQAIADSPEALSRFEREAQAAAELRSTHIVQILDYGVDDGTPYIAMELLEGESLAALLARSGKLAPDRVARLFSQAARGLSRAHDKGVVHRDLKPDNIFIAREGEDEVVKVLDFGIAKKLDRLTPGLGIKTHTGSVLGSPFYMSPEQATGLPSIDHRSDIWSFAVVAYECLTGTRPFERRVHRALAGATSRAIASRGRATRLRRVVCARGCPTPGRSLSIGKRGCTTASRGMRAADRCIDKHGGHTYPATESDRAIGHAQ